jgi:hypothetical protein
MAIEALEAIGIAGNIIQFIDFAARLISTAFEIHASATGNSREFEEVDAVTTHLRVQLSILTQAFNSSQDYELKNLLQSSMDVASELSSLVEGKGRSKGRVDSILKAMSALRNREKVSGLEGRVNRIRNGILTHLNVLV